MFTKKKTNKRLLIIALAIVMVLSSATVAFAAWTSFQNDNSLNNGVIGNDGYTYRTEGPATVNVYHGLTNAGWSGIDTAPLVNVENGVPYAYVLYSANAGAKVAKVNLNNMTAPTGWETGGVVVNAAGGFQLSTPLISDDTLYTAGNVYANIVLNDGFSGYTNPDFANWTVTPGAGVNVTQSVIDSGNHALKATAVTAGSKTVTSLQSGVFTINSNQLSNLRIAGGLKLTNVSSVTVYVSVNGSVVGTYGHNSSVPGATPLVLDNGLYCWNENMTAQTATTHSMQVRIDFTAGANGSVEMDYAQLYEQSSGIGKIENISTSTAPSCTGLVGGIIGQINTPITEDGENIYFGTYTTNGKYYKVNKTNGNTLTFDMTGNSVYWAGAAVCGKYLVFGTENGTLYVLNKNDMSVKSTATLPTPSIIRSTICAVQNGTNYDLYFTSRTDSDGYLWRYTFDIGNEDLSSNWQNPVSVGYTNSTPVVAGDHVYVGSKTGVHCVGTDGISKWSTTGNADFSAIEYVQASPIVKSITADDVTTDYIYVTTNKSNGNGYCISYVRGASAPTLAWATSLDGGVSTFTLQGFAAGGGYLVFGNDYSKLAIIN